LPMMRPDSEIFDKDMILLILDMCKVINIGMNDGKYPYVLPCNFGYTFDDDLIFYTHHALKGHKLDLLKKDPNVCVVTHIFGDGIVNPRSPSHAAHDYRSVMAFGTMQQLAPHTDEYKTALRRLYECNGRSYKITDAFLNASYEKRMGLYRIVCPKEQVRAKSQNPISHISEIPLSSVQRER